MKIIRFTLNALQIIHKETVKVYNFNKIKTMVDKYLASLIAPIHALHSDSLAAFNS